MDRNREQMARSSRGADVRSSVLPSFGQRPQQTLDAISTPDSADTRIGTLAFKDGAPSAETAQAVYDHLDFT
jgi:hypothetical protein